MNEMDDIDLRGKNVLVVDDEVDLREIIASEFEFMGAKVYQAGNITAADSVLKQNTIDLIISDIRMPGGTGVDLLRTVKARNILNPPIILITGFADITPEEAYAEGAEALLNKPFKLDELIHVSGRLIKSPENRFSEEQYSPSKTVTFISDKTVKETRNFEIGRGGVFLMTDNSQKFEIGEAVDLLLKFSDTEIKSVAVVRWTKTSDQEGKICMGCELVKLDKNSLGFLNQYWKKSPGLAYIPKSH